MAPGMSHQGDALMAEIRATALSVDTARREGNDHALRLRADRLVRQVAFLDVGLARRTIPLPGAWGGPTWACSHNDIRSDLTCRDCGALPGSLPTETVDSPPALP